MVINFLSLGTKGIYKFLYIGCHGDKNWNFYRLLKIEQKEPYEYSSKIHNCSVSNEIKDLFQQGKSITDQLLNKIKESFVNNFTSNVVGRIDKNFLLWADNYGALDWRCQKLAGNYPK